MAAVIALAAICLVGAGALAGITGMVAVAIRREDRNLTLTSQAPGTVTRAGRRLTGLHVRTHSGGREKRRPSPRSGPTFGQAELIPGRPSLSGFAWNSTDRAAQPPHHLIAGAAEQTICVLGGLRRERDCGICGGPGLADQ
ncbi:MAG TPA: hypothetical protein VG123_30415 [Streptosporangiaceae bacterium]|jgi:hypothetical protein|nr:hypothetical protein [Streptosporangiaceae bacterium]